MKQNKRKVKKDSTTNIVFHFLFFSFIDSCSSSSNPVLESLFAQLECPKKDLSCYRIATRGRSLQRLYGKKWASICKHDRRSSQCKHCQGPIRAKRMRKSQNIPFFMFLFVVATESDEPADEATRVALEGMARRLHPMSCYRFKDGKIQRKFGRNWNTVCTHDKLVNDCKECLAKRKPVTADGKSCF